MSSFTDKTVLITGAASGIGRLLARLFAADGAHVVLWDLNRSGLDDLARELSSGPGRATTYVCDLSRRDAIGTRAEEVLADVGPIDILINNAGIVTGSPLLEISDEAIERTFAVNTLAGFWTTRAFLPGMVEQGHGHVVTIASAGGIVGTARMTDYCSSKFAAIGFDESLRLECKRLGYPIDTTVVCPFYIDTGMFAGVKTRFSWLLPILKPDYAAMRIFKAIRARKRRLLMPRFVYVVYPIRLLPVNLFDSLMNFFGVNKSMDEFRGRI